MRTRKEICQELNIANRTFDSIVKYLNLNFIEKKHEKSHTICKFYSDEDEAKIRKFLEKSSVNIPPFRVECISELKKITI